MRIFSTDARLVYSRNFSIFRLTSGGFILYRCPSIIANHLQYGLVSAGVAKLVDAPDLGSGI